MNAAPNRPMLANLALLLVLGCVGGIAVPAGAQSTGAPSTENKPPDSKAAPANPRRGTTRGRRRGGRTPLVVVAKVQIRLIGNRVAAVGTGRAARHLTISAEVSGVIEDLRFTPGQSVKQGAPLVILNSEAQRIAVRLAQVKVDDARAALQRYETLAERNATSTVQLEQARTALAVTRADLDAKQYELRRRTIVAPFEGVMGLTTLVKGDYLKEGAPIATIDDRSSLHLEFVVSERAASHIKIGQAVRALTPAITGVVFHGKVSAVDSRIDAASRTLRVEAILPNPQQQLLPGMTFSVSIRIPGQRLPSVPGLAIKWDRNGAHVWRVGANNKVSRVGVTIRRRENDLVSVESSLQENQLIVVEGMQNLRPGMTVRIASGNDTAIPANR